MMFFDHVKLVHNHQENRGCRLVSKACSIDMELGRNRIHGRSTDIDKAQSPAHRPCTADLILLLVCSVPAVLFVQNSKASHLHGHPLHAKALFSSVLVRRSVVGPNRGCGRTSMPKRPSVFAGLLKFNWPPSSLHIIRLRRRAVLGRFELASLTASIDPRPDPTDRIGSKWRKWRREWSGSLAEWGMFKWMGSGGCSSGPCVFWKKWTVWFQRSNEMDREFLLAKTDARFVGGRMH